MAEPKNFQELFDFFGRPRDLREALNASNTQQFSRQNINSWLRKKSVPPVNFLAVVNAANHAGIEGVTLELLYKLTEESKNEQ